MISVRHIVGWLLGLVGLGLCLFTLWHFVLTLSSQSVPEISENLPCCGQYLGSVCWNLILLMAFIVQHSGMSSKTWKRMLKFVGLYYLLHRPLYVISSCCLLLWIMYQMSALPGPPLWYFSVDEYPALWLSVVLLHCMMWFIICAGAIAADPMELVGLKPLYSDEDSAQTGFEGMQSTHVGVVAFVVILWVHMAMSVERFLLAMVWTMYVLFQCRFSSYPVFIIHAKNN